MLDSQVYNPLLNIVIDNLIIGKRGDAYPFYFPGIIDEVKVSNTASTSFDVGSPPIVDANTLGLWHFDEVTGSTAADATGAHNGLLMNDPNWVASTIPAAGPQWVSGQTGFGDALSFDGDDYIEMSASSSLDVSNPYTIEAWVNISSSVQTPPYKYVGIFRRGSLGAASQIEIYTQPYGAGYGGKFTVVHNRNGAFTYRYFPALPLDQWVHVGVVRNGTSWAVYYDTVPQSEISGPGNTSPAVSLLGSFIGIGYAGSNQYTPGYMRGTVDEVRVWGSALDASQLDDMTPPTITTNVTDGSFYPKPTTGFNLIFGATDAGTGVKSVTATLNGSPVVSGNNLASGEYTLIINAEDAALNKSQTTVHFYVLGNWVTGGGTIKSRGRPTWMLAGNVGIVDGVGIVGNIQIQNNADGEQYHLNDISSLAFSGGSATSPSASNNTVDFVGTDDGGTPVRVIIQDLGEKGARVDKLAIDIGNDGSFELLETVISTGNYQIHGGVSPIVYQLIDCPLNYPSAPFPPGTGFVAFTSPSSGTLRVTLDLFGVQATTAYDVWLGVDSWVGTGGKLGTPTTDSSGNYSGYFDFTVSTGLHRLNIDIVLKDSGSDIYELPGIHGSPTTWVQFTVQ